MFTGKKVYIINKRLIDIIIRKGAYSNTQYHIPETYKQKGYFNNLLGYNLYNLFSNNVDSAFNNLKETNKRIIK